MKTDPVLKAQAVVNSQDQFLSSKTLKDNLLIAVASTWIRRAGFWSGLSGARGWPDCRC